MVPVEMSPFRRPLRLAWAASLELQHSASPRSGITRVFEKGLRAVSKLNLRVGAAVLASQCTFIMCYESTAFLPVKRVQHIGI